MAKNLQISFLLDFYGEMLTEKQREMIEYYYNEDLSLAEIADNQGITRQGVRDSIKRAEAQLLEMEERLGLARRFREMREGLSRSATPPCVFRNTTPGTSTPRKWSGKSGILSIRRRSSVRMNNRQF